MIKDLVTLFIAMFIISILVGLFYRDCFNENKLDE